MLDLVDRLVVVVGGGSVAARKVRGILAAGGNRVRVVAPVIGEMPAVVERVVKAYEARDLSGAGLVFAATDSAAVNDAVVRDAKGMGVLVSRADASEDEGGDFVTPARFAEGPVIVAVSGGSPALSVLIRDNLVRQFNPAWARLAEAMAALRPEIVHSSLDIETRRALFRELASEHAIEVLLLSGIDGLRAWIGKRYPAHSMPSTGQISLLIAAVAFFMVAAGLSFLRLWKPTNVMRLAAKSCLYFGILGAGAVLTWHCVSRGGWMPIGDNFDALLWLAILLALFVAYVQRTRPLAALDWFVLPVVVLLLICAAVFGRTEFHRYVGRTWASVHRVTSYAGAVAFAVAAASGAMYVLASARLRRKQPVGSYLGSLERLEHLTMTAVTLGFALLTVGIITGIVQLIGRDKGTPTTKVALTACVWIVYAIVLHAPINPVFRGRRAAVLSVVGFVLMVGALVAAQFLPGGGGH